MELEVDKQQSGYNIPRRTKMWRTECEQYVHPDETLNYSKVVTHRPNMKQQNTKYTAKTAQILER